jgi:4-amino-4-deoxy-L-arabinose transferase-like glycosyltransferase
MIAARRISSDEARWALMRLLPVLGALMLASLLLEPSRATSSDEAPLIAAAHRILHGHYAVVGTKDATKYLWHGPGLPALISPLVAIGLSVGGLRMTSPLLMFAAVLLFYRFLRLRLGRRGALIGAYCLGLYGPGYYVLGTVSKDPLALLCAIAALDAMARYVKDGRRHHALIAGLCLGALAMTRLEYGYVLGAALAIALGWWLTAHLRRGAAPEKARAARRFALICGLGMLACVPWLAYTYSVTRHVFYWGNSGGISLYWMSSPSSGQLGEWHAWHTVFTDPALAAYRPLFRHIGTLSPLQQDLSFQHIAISQALGHPAKYALNLMANVGRMFFGYPFSFTLPIAIVIGLILFNGSLLVGSAVAGVSMVRARVSPPPETLPFLLFAALGLAVHLLPSAEPRMLLPIVPVLIWLIGQAHPAFSSAGDAVARALRWARPRAAFSEPAD